MIVRADLQSPNRRIVVALDVANVASLQNLLGALRGQVGLLKIGMELFTALGPKAIELVHEQGERVFLDLKFHDIPNTVASAVRAAARLGVELLTVHAAGGSEMLRAAVAAARSITPSPAVIGVTILTSLSDADLASIGLQGPTASSVERLAEVALSAGLDGLVCSPQEVGMLRKRFGASPWLITPGVRPAGAALNDQQRIATPAAAIAAGADLLVVGRPITQAKDPAAAAEAIAREIAMAIPDSR
jgi:orotidine-5'-phosphate decarboxylase